MSICSISVSRPVLAIVTVLLCTFVNPKTLRPMHK